VWLLVVSIQWRNPLLLGGGETLLRVLLFWGMFLPLGAVWSIDRARGRTPEPSSLRVLSVPTAALFLQIAFVYWFAVLLKSGPEWRVHGTAIQYALSVDELARPLGTFLLHYPALLTVLTFGVLALEAFGPFLLFSPLFTGPVRTVAVALFMSFQLGIWLTLGMGIFPAVAGLCMVCFLPSWFWDRVGRRRRAGDGRSRTAARMAAGNGKPAATFRTSRAISVLTAVLLVYVFWWNIGTVSGLRMPEPVARLGQFLALAQIWDMFAPSPLMDDGWYIIPGTLQDGRTVDLAGVLTGDEGLRPVSGRRPSNIRATFKNERWRKYLENLRLRHVSQHLYLSRYICREWNHHHTGGQAVTRLLIVFEGDRTLLNGHRAPPEPRRLWTQVCP
jgi:hypothetical protein